jgi:flagellar basal-body rod protein FlgG
MIRSLSIAATGMAAQQTNIDVIANNLANVNTAGFKSSRAEFQDLLYQNIKMAGVQESQGAIDPSSIQIGLGTRTSGTQKVFTQGDLSETDNQLDLAIQGDGFFQIQMPDGTTAYTRDGSFKLDSQGRMVTSDGYPLIPQITIDQNATSISIGNDGTVSLTESGSTNPVNKGQITLAKFLNSAGLNSNGQNLLTATAASGEPITSTPGTSGMGTLSQKFLESSNVQVVNEMVNMITAQRAYEVNSKAIQTSDDMLNVANQLKR